MYPETGKSVIDLARFPHAEAVLDVVYNPARTKLILDAESRGIPCLSGLYMLVAQAARACRLWTNTEVSVSRLDEIHRIIGQEMQNIVLIGMPGCGKSSVGFCLAKKLGRWLVDADKELEGRIGMTIPQYMQSHSEEEFRLLETQVLADLGKRSGLVIATGGGCVTRPENYPLLHQNSTIVWLQRNLEALPTDGRPISQRDGVAQLYEKRKPLYEAFCDLQVQNAGSVEETAEQILQLLKK